MVQQVVKGIMEAKGHRLFVSGTVRNAMTMIQAGKADVILLDLNLPDARGEDVVRAIRTQMKLDTPIVCLGFRRQVHRLRKPSDRRDRQSLRRYG